MTNKRIEINVKGQWMEVPVVEVKGQTIVAHGKYVRIASVHDEAWMTEETHDPEACSEALKRQGQSVRADIFAFSQKLPDKAPKYSYPMEWESIAAVELKSFKEWWDGLPQEARKNVRRAQKRGVTIEVRRLTIV